MSDMSGIAFGFFLGVTLVSGYVYSTGKYAGPPLGMLPGLVGVIGMAGLRLFKLI